MKHLIFVCLVVFLGSVLSAQTDPQWLWATRAGSAGNDYGYSISRDNAGNLYVTGYFQETAQFGGSHVTTAGNNDIFVAKLDPNGNWLWAVRAGGTGVDVSSSISTDGDGNSYIAGYFAGTADFGATTLTSAGDWDIFIAKLDPNGNWLWARSAGGPSEDWGLIVTYRDGYCYLTGKFMGSAIFGTTNHSSAGSYDIFVARLDTSGNWLWVKRAGGAGLDEGDSVSIDANGNCYVSGYFAYTANFGTLTLTSSGSGDVFATKLDPDGNWIWANSAGGTGNEGAWSISADDSGNCNVTGLFQNSAIFGNTTLQCLGSIDIFVARLDSEGNWLWARRAGGSNAGANNDVGICIALENNGNCYVTGAFFGADADFGSFVLPHSGDYDYFIAQLDVNGNWLWATTGDGIYSDSCWGVCFDGEGNFYVTGTFSSTMNFGTIQMTSVGAKDVWVAKLASAVGIDDELAPGITGVSCLYAAYPNPFRQGGTSLIKANIAERESGTLTIYNLRGQIIQSQQLSSGSHQLTLDGSNLPSGVYLYQLTTPTLNTTRKLVLLK